LAAAVAERTLSIEMGRHRQRGSGNHMTTANVLRAPRG